VGEVEGEGGGVEGGVGFVTWNENGTGGLLRSPVAHTPHSFIPTYSTSTRALDRR